MENIISDFVRYHVMDRSVAIGLAPDPNSSKNYESMKRNPETGRFFPIRVEYDQKSITVTDVTGSTQNVVTTPGLYNNICREYWYETLENRGSKLFMGSDAVVHLLQQPLKYETMRPWSEVVEEYLKNN